METKLNLNEKAHTINILVVDDHPIMRQSLVSMLVAQGPPFKIRGAAKSPEEALAIIQGDPPDIVLTDLHMSSMSGFTLIEAIGRTHPNIRSLVFTASFEEEYMLQAFDVGAFGFVVKDAEAGELLRAIEAVSRGYTHFPLGLSRALEKRTHRPALSSRECEVLSLIADGLTSKEIARALGVEYRTIETHRSRIRQRFGLETSAALLRFAIENRSRVR